MSTQKKKVKLILTVFTDGTHSLIEPDNEASTMDDPTTPEDPGDGIETPPQGPGNP